MTDWGYDRSCLVVYLRRPRRLPTQLEVGLRSPVNRSFSLIDRHQAPLAVYNYRVDSSLRSYI
jgi:hypothetical protein